jgi:hypothetical protein
VGIKNRYRNIIIEVTAQSNEQEEKEGKEKEEQRHVQFPSTALDYVLII